jgi:hypothetical protein
MFVDTSNLDTVTKKNKATQVWIHISSDWQLILSIIIFFQT